MSTKECPSCGTEVPTVAQRCKVCFHDFNEEPPPPTMGPMVLLVAFAAMVVIGAAALGWVVMMPTDKGAFVDPENENIVWVTKYRTGEKTETVDWSEIGKVEHVTTNRGTFEINVVTLDGERRQLELSRTQSLTGRAEWYAEQMNKPVEMVDETRSFHQTATQQAAGE